MNTYEFKHDWSLTFCMVLYLFFWVPEHFILAKHGNLEQEKGNLIVSSH